LRAILGDSDVDLLFSQQHLRRIDVDHFHRFQHRCDIDVRAAREL
jgi:hypothetical protein